VKVLHDALGKTGVDEKLGDMLGDGGGLGGGLEDN
jgi:hypothetical protein